MIDISKFKALFISEAEDHLQKLNDTLLALEKKPEDRQLLDGLMRSSHTIKSSSATMGYKKMAFLTHVMEDMFDYARNKMLKITPQIINEVLQALDALEKSLASVKKTDKELNLDPVVARLQRLTGVTTEKPVTPRGSLSPAPDQKIGKSPLEALETRMEGLSHIKVPVERLDSLMDLMEELLIDKMRLEQRKKINPELEEVVDHLSRLVSEIQYQVMQARLVPVEQIFARFPRMVHDLSQEQNKKVELEITGSEMELDRTIIDKLGEPLVHLLRNAVDHGIPAAKVSAGEEKTYHIRLSVKREKDVALVVVENEGKGIDFEKVKQAAVRRNIVGAKEAESLNESQLINLLYHHSLSTKEKVTETSGRGIGLSVVKNFVDQIGGRIIVESPIAEGSLPSDLLAKTSASTIASANGGGTRFTLELPLTLAILKSLLIGVENSIFAIPFSSIERLVSVARKDIKSMADQDMAVVENIDVPLVRLAKVLNLEAVRKEPPAHLTMVLVKRGEDIAGIVVDKVIDEQEIIVKPLPSVLRGTKGFSGSTILGDGNTIFILDIVSLFEDTSKFIRTA